MSKKEFDQKGFTLIELLVVMSIIGVLSMVAVPKFTNTISLANTSKIQSDLRVLNTSITLYQAQNGKYPSNLTTDLKDYIVDIDNLHPPKGSCFLRTGETLEITDKNYTYSSEKHEALCQSHSLSEFGRKTE